MNHCNNFAGQRVTNKAHTDTRARYVLQIPSKIEFFSEMTAGCSMDWAEAVEEM